jgi:CBS domain-containing protein
MPEVSVKTMKQGFCRLEWVAELERKGEPMKIERFYRPEIMSADVWDSLSDAAGRMQFYEVGSLVVFDQRQLAGIITERDLVRAMSDGVDPERVPVRRYMTENPQVVDPDTEVDEAVRTMIDLGIRHLPVVEGERVVGMVSVRDLLTEEHAVVVAGR